MANTISTFTWTHEKESAFLQEFFESQVFAKQISRFKTGIKVLENPYMEEPVTTVSSPITNLYTPQDLVTVDENLTVNKESKAAAHILDYEERFSDYNLGAEFLMKIAKKHAIDVDKDLALELATNAGNTITVGGPFTSTNIIDMIALADGYLSGYAEAMNGTYLWIDSTSMPAFTVTGALNGFSFADSVLKNGYTGKNFMGHEIYVSRGTLPADTALAGIKKVSSTGTGGDVHIERKGVSGKFGIEYATVMYYTSKLWTNSEDLVIKYDLAVASS